MSFSGLYGDMNWDNHHCHSALISTISYFFAKNFLYQLFVLRLYTIYNHSSFQYPITLLASLSIFSFIACLSWIVWVCLKIEIENQSQNSYGCIVYTPSFFNESGAFIDLIISSICLYLFLKPLLALSKIHQKSEMSTVSPSSPSQSPSTKSDDGDPGSKYGHGHTHTHGHMDAMDPVPAPTLSRSHSRRDANKTKDDKNMYFVAEKYTLLSVIGIMSTFFITIIVGTVGGGAFIVIDAVINCVVVVLMNERYNNLYTRTCGPCRKCQSVCIQCCYCVCRRNDEIELANNMGHHRQNDRDGNGDVDVDECPL